MFKLEISDILIDILIATGIVLIPTIWFVRKAVKQEESKINNYVTENSSKFRSYVDKDKNEIILFSKTFPNIASQVWVTTESAIRISSIDNFSDIKFENYKHLGKTIMFSKIQNVELTNNKLTFYTLGLESQFVADGIWDDELVNKPQQIIFNHSDFHIAIAIRDRITKNNTI